MAYEIPCFLVAFEAGADLSACQFYHVKIASGNKVVACAAPTDRPIGILQNAPKAGGEASVMIIGISKVSSDAALAVGAVIGTSVDGQAVTKTVGTDVTHYMSGSVIEASTAANGLATALINCAAPARAV